MTPVKPIPRVVDVYHGDVFNADVKHSLHLTDDMAALASVGIWGIIHKATQGLGNTDSAYHQRRAAANTIGLFWGAYHFNTGDTIQAQVDHFFDAAQPDANTLMCLDFEDNRQSQMSLNQAIQFIQLADEKLGRPIWVYGGNRPKEMFANPSQEVRETLARSHWWICQYSLAPILNDVNGHPLPFRDAPLWQYTGDNLGQPPHVLPGIATKGIDINHFAGTKDELKAIWAGN